MNWLSDNFEWIFGGIGATVVGVLLTFWLSRRLDSARSRSIQQTQRGGDGSRNFQAAGDINVSEAGGERSGE